MGKILYFPGCKPTLRSQADLVEEATTVLMKEVAAVFIENRMEPGSFELWHKRIQEYLKAAPIHCDDQGNIVEQDLWDWRKHWRRKAWDRVLEMTRIY